MIKTEPRWNGKHPEVRKLYRLGEAWLSFGLGMRTIKKTYLKNSY